MSKIIQEKFNSYSINTRMASDSHLSRTAMQAVKMTANANYILSFKIFHFYISIKCSLVKLLSS